VNFGKKNSEIEAGIKRMNKRILRTTTLLFFFTYLAVFSDGYRNTPEGAAAIGAFGGHRAFADDANATIHNSASLVDLEQPMLQMNTALGYADAEYRGIVGNDRTENPFYTIPGFSLAIPFNEGQYALGFATYIPYGRSFQWGSTSPFAQNGIPYEGSMMVMDFTPNLAVRLTDSFSVGIGADIYYGSVEQRQYMYGNYNSKLTGDGTALGWNASALWKMTDRQRLALTYRSSVAINYEGDLTIDSLGTSQIEAEIEYPSIIALAYGFEFTDKLRAELNLEWLEFSVYQNLVIYDRPTGTPLALSPQNMNDTWTVGIGGEWDFAEHWTARSGLMYIPSPTPDTTMGTLGAEEDQGIISIGLGYENDTYLLDIGYALGLFDGRSISSSANSPDGDYDFNVHVLSLSYGYKF
jgi:long-chain fatty acid transport protein